MERAVERLELMTPTSEWDERDLVNSAEALRRLADVAPSLDLGARVLRTKQRGGSMLIADVEVSVRPMVTVWRDGLLGSEVGALKLAFTKNRRVPEEEADHAATVVRRFVESRLAGLSVKVEPSLIQVIDVFGRRIFLAPVAFKQQMAEVTATCEVIARVWPRPDDRRPDQPSPIQPSPN